MANQRFRTTDFRSTEVRLSFPKDLFDPRTNKGDDGKDRITFGCNLIVDKAEAAFYQEKVSEVVKGQWGEEGPKRFAAGKIRNPLLAGDGEFARDKNGDIREGLGEDKVLIRPSSTKQPGFFQRQDVGGKIEIVKLSIDDARTLFAPGCYVYAGMNAYSWHSNGKDGVSFGISMLLFSREGEALGGTGGADAASLFGDVAAPGGDASSMFN